MPEGQDAIYYATGPSRSALENSPHMEAFRAKGYEVLLLTDPVDEVWVESVPAFEGKPFVSIAKGEVDLGGEDVDDDAKPGFADLLTWMGTALADDVKEVRLSHRLTDSAACLVGDPGDLTPTLEKMYRAMGQELPKVKRILELNPRHALVTGLRAAHGQQPGRRRARDTAHLLYGMALLAEGGELADPRRSWRCCRDGWSRPPAVGLILPRSPRRRARCGGERPDPAGRGPSSVIPCTAPCRACCSCSLPSPG